MIGLAVPGFGVKDGRGAGVDLTGGAGAGPPGEGFEKAGPLRINPPRLNTISTIMLLVFIIFCVLKPLKRWDVATATELSSPGQ